MFLNISADEPILSRTTSYNYTALLTSDHLSLLHTITRSIYLGAIFQAKIDIEHMSDDQLLSTTIFSVTSSDPSPVLNRTRRLLFVLLGIGIVTIVFALTIFFFQRMYV